MKNKYRKSNVNWSVKGVHPKHKNQPTVEIIIIVMTIITR